MSKFIGRTHELGLLQELLKKKSSSLIVIRGRRRIGKSRLAEEFSKSFPTTYSFTGLPPTPGISAERQREEFSKQMRQHGIVSTETQDWSDIFFDLAKRCKSGRVLIILDEISWMGSKDPAFLGKLKIAWDQHFKKNPQLLMVLSGSNSSWIEKNILSSTGFLGRISLRLHLEELSLAESNRFWGTHRDRVAPYDKFKILCVTGGVPRYLEEILPDKSAEANIQRMCFEKEGLLFNEFDDIFSDLFAHRSLRYKDIVKQLIDGPLSLNEIVKNLDRAKGGDLSEYVEDLCETGFVSRDFTWKIKDGVHSKLSQLRLSDNYLRFYLKYIEPHKHSIATREFGGLPRSWYSILGLHFENLVLNSRKQLYHLLKIPTRDVLVSSPYFQTKTAARESCQIDLMIQTKFNTLYLCEIKFEKRPVGRSVIKEVQEKISRLSLPKGFSCRPVLIHVNGVSDSVFEAEYFSEIIDFGQFLE